MKTIVRLDGVESSIEIEPGGGRWTWRLDGRERSASVIEVEAGVYSVLLEGRSYEVRVAGARDGGMAIEVAGRVFAASVVDPREWRPPENALAETGACNVTAPMPGRVVRVLVAEGEQVAAGQGLVVVEAMKMQNEIQSPKAGRVISIRAAAGGAAAAGDVLAVVE